MLKKKEGFQGQKAIVLPPSVIEVCKAHPLLAGFYFTDIGFYPEAEFHYRVRPEGIPQHILIYCIKGKGWVEVDGKKWEVKPNEYVILPSNEPHKYGALQENPWSIFWVHFNGNEAKEISNVLKRNGQLFVHHAPFTLKLEKSWQEIYQTLESGYMTENLLISNSSLRSFFLILAFGASMGQNAPVKDLKAIDQSIAFMRANLDHCWPLKDLAKKVNLSKSHYANEFKNHTGYSPIVYFNHLKIQKACQYLQFTNLNINEVANALGFGDPYYFSRLFSKSMGISPSGYRKRKL
ncbi:AraC family transcriptional regulator [Echinicola jeungdonensis]|uniref:Helix-turn-helix domain-containing protein n=1 Tax=Echinicola jeungdonensis TaxID=709343 RepID=A0ABV5J9F0_9BACT|nr:AraC family transcriptional regulator [Echinicola jeungdonensis]MDN3670450.1 AraC family transcriptional regulator [Echinicola jeungdonensis]